MFGFARGRWLGRAPRGVLAFGGLVVVGVFGASVVLAAGGLGVRLMHPISRTVTLPAACLEGRSDAILNAEIEPYVAVNPQDPQNVVAIWQQGPHAGSVADLLAWSGDGGRSFHRVLLPGTIACTGGEGNRITDPWLSFGPRNTVYASTMRFEGTVLVNHSEDGGRSWRNAVPVAPTSFENDKPTVTADPSRPGRVYLVFSRHFGGTGHASVMFARSLNRGTTWSTPRQVFNPADPHTGPAGAQLLVGAHGALVIVFGAAGAQNDQDRGQMPLLAIRSRDGGSTWSKPVLIGRVGLYPLHDPSSGTYIADANELFSATADADGKLYVAVHEVSSTKAARIVLFTSTDGGKRWSAKHTIARIPAQAFEPSVAVNQDGTVGVAWYDLRQDRPGDSAVSTDYRFAYSADQGHSWRQLKIAGPFDLRTAAGLTLRRAGAMFLGDYQGLAGTNHGFASLFTQAGHGNDGPTDIFYASIAPSRP